MNDHQSKIEKIVKGALGGAIDSALSTTPALAIVWGAIKGGVNAIRKKRAEVFLNFAVSNINIEMFNNDQFVDGFSLTFEEYIKQRNEKKRKCIENIFLGFVDSKFDDNFEIERMYDLLNKINLSHAKLLKDIQSVGVNGLEIYEDKKGEYGINMDKKHDDYNEIKYLEYLGLVEITNYRELESEEELEGNREDGFRETGKLLYSLKQIENAYLTNFGGKFINYLLHD
jgi:hypothetical protein